MCGPRDKRNWRCGLNQTLKCSDRHSRCAIWASENECQKNQLWMAENCRMSCGRCHKLRVDICRL
ncbi:unnamed protein product [Onchocerca flexuosa]|uniref:ShKT domain-containing protein n=1 Tax=Onchocerca flexuosa TaxID=387005 RepID=A0A183I076_9BILA|nr:unnamed protein product [Onchocerca flexuosa]